MIKVETDHELFQVLIHQKLGDAFQQWLEERGLFLYHLPMIVDDLPTYGIGIKIEK